ncbi:alpha/beta fold hydrolase [Micromonospora sp. KC213]|nr:alpha/beta fold hydrolase [Micromonospora sp. KC213]
MSSIYRSENGRRAVEERYRAFLHAWPVPSTESLLSTRQGDTFVVSCGPPDAPPVVLLHGGGFNSAAWLSDVADWAQTHRVYAVDVIGEPGLSAPSRPSLESDAYAEWLDDVLDGLGITRTAFVGASLGGWLALDFAVRRPERVARLALLVPAGIGRQKHGALIASLFLVPFGKKGQRAAYRFVLGPAPASKVSGAEAALHRDFADYLLLILMNYRMRRERLPVFTDEQLRHLDAPMLVIAGAKDRILDTHHTARRLRHLCPDAAVTLLPDTGHIPTGYAETIQRFLTDADQE